MSNTQLSILVLVAAALATTTVLLYTADVGRETEIVRGAPLIQQAFEVESVHKIEVRSGDTTVTLVRRPAARYKIETKDGNVTVDRLAGPEAARGIKSDGGKVVVVSERSGFTVAEKHDYRAAPKSVNQLILKCLDITCAARITDDPDNHVKLGVAEKEDKDEAEDGEGEEGEEEEEEEEEDKWFKPVFVSFFDEQGERLTGFVKGKSAEGGVYVRLLGEDTVYRTEDSFWLDTSPSDYIDKTLAEVKKDHVKQVDVALGEKTYTIQRDKDKKVTLLAIPKKPRAMRAKGTDYDNVFDALRSLDLSDVLTEDEAKKNELKWDAVYTAQLYTGAVYTVRLAKKDSDHYVRLRAEFRGGDKAWLEEKKADPKAYLKRADLVALAETAAPRFNLRHTGWVYKVPGYKADDLRKPFDELIEEDLPDSVHASHILIAYKGAEKADEKLKRSKQDAKKLADKVLKEAQVKDADFAKLVKRYSEDAESKKKDGDVGEVKKDGDMEDTFELAARRLKLNEITPQVVETKFGFHIIKRTK